MEFFERFSLVIACKPAFGSKAWLWLQARLLSQRLKAFGFETMALTTRRSKPFRSKPFGFERRVVSNTQCVYFRNFFCQKCLANFFACAGGLLACDVHTNLQRMPLIRTAYVSHTLRLRCACALDAHTNAQRTST